jgi:hypothetical protein
MQRRVSLELDDDSDLHSRLEALPTVSRLHRRNHRWEFYVAEFPPLLRLLAGLPVRDVVIEPPPLEDVFLQYYEDPADDD